MKNQIKLLVPALVASMAAVSFTGCETRGYSDAGVVSYRVGGYYKTLPRRHHSFDMDGTTYYRANNHFFINRNGRYLSVRSPFGSRRVTYTYGDRYDRLPPGYRTMRYRNRDYYYHDGRYFRNRGSAYFSVRSPFY